MNATSTRKPRSTLRKILIGIAAIFVALLIIGFIGNLVDPLEPEPAAETEVSATTEPIPAPEPTATPSSTPTPSSASTTTAPSPALEAPKPAATPDDLALLQAELVDYVEPHWDLTVSDVSVEDQLVVIDTDLVDPRGDSSPEGIMAATVCSAGERAFGADKTVRVQESDGTTFATNQFGQCEEY